MLNGKLTKLSLILSFHFSLDRKCKCYFLSLQQLLTSQELTVRRLHSSFVLLLLKPAAFTGATGNNSNCSPFSFNKCCDPCSSSTKEKLKMKATMLLSDSISFQSLEVLYAKFREGHTFLTTVLRIQNGNSGNRKLVKLHMKLAPHNSRKPWWMLKGGENRIWLTQPSVGFFILHFCYWVWLKILKLLKYRSQMVLGPVIEQKR